MRVLMFGWEFPPHISGGLGTACHGLTQAMRQRGAEILFVIPRARGPVDSHVHLISAAHVPLRVTHGRRRLARFLLEEEVRCVDSLLRPYLNEPEYRALLSRREWERECGPEPRHRESVIDMGGDYGPNLLSEVIRYSEVAGALALRERFDVIHAHDWMTALAGVRARKLSGKPLVYHAHALEFDRSGENINRDVYAIEKLAMETADQVIAVSHYTRGIILARYGIPPEKVAVVHNAVSRRRAGAVYHVSKDPGRRIVLFLGRVTFQKGPDYFVEAAARVLRSLPDVTFVMAGSGDMLPRMVDRVAQLHIGRSFHFTGFLGGDDVERMYAMSDVYVMPSVSEPFGIAPLEAMLYDVPVIVSRQAGVAEVLRHALQVDFWDIDEMASKIAALIRYPVLAREVVRNGRRELRSIRWAVAADAVLQIYERLTRAGASETAPARAGNGG